MSFCTWLHFQSYYTYQKCVIPMSPGFFVGLEEVLALTEVLINHIKAMGWKDRNQGRFNRVWICQKWKGSGWVTHQMSSLTDEFCSLQISQDSDLQLATVTEWSREGSQDGLPMLHCFLGSPCYADRDNTGRTEIWLKRVKVEVKKDWSLGGKFQHDHGAFSLYMSGFM